MKFAHTILIKISVFINFGDFQVLMCRSYLFCVITRYRVFAIVGRLPLSSAYFMDVCITPLDKLFLNNHRPTYTSHFIC